MNDTEETKSCMVDEITPEIKKFLNKYNIDISDRKIEKTTKHFKQLDIMLLFCFINVIFLILMLFVYVDYVLFEKFMDINLSHFANALNIGIICIGATEGIRGFNKNATENDGKSYGLPYYKVKYMLVYQLFFAGTLVFSILCTFYCSLIEIDNEKAPDFVPNEISMGLLSNYISYLFARFGSKLGENIDLTSIPFFKRKL